MSHARNLALAFAGAALFASLPASADTSAPASTPVIIVQQGAPVPLATQPAAPAPAPVQPGYAPGYPPGGYPPGAYPVPYPGAYPAPYYGPGGYYAPPPPAGYYTARYAPMPMTERQSVGAVVGGGIAIGAGGVLVIAALFAAIPTCDDFGSGTCNNHTGTVIGLTVAGLAAIAVGIPLVVYGNKRIPVGTAAAAATSDLPAWVGKPGGTGWRWSF